MNQYLYHIHTEGMGLDQGYIGITIDPVARFKAHKSTNLGKNPPSNILRHAFSKYKDDIRMSILGVFDTREEVLWAEFTLRPSEKIGWNISTGGGYSPMYGRRHTIETRAKMSQNNTYLRGHESPKAKPVNLYCYYTDDLLYENVVIEVWARENNSFQSNLIKKLQADRSKPSTRTNKRHCKGVYALYV
jgi:predicted GIY-YIG superfamily endonuclease